MSDNKGDINTSVWDEEWPRITWHYMPTSPRPLVLLHFCHSTDNITSEAVASKRPSVITVHSPSSRTATQQRIKTSAWCSIGWHQVEHRPSGFSMETIFSTERFHANEQILSLTEFKPELYFFCCLKLKICFLNTTYRIMLMVTMTMNTSKGEIDVLFPDTLAILIHSLAFAWSFFSSG